MKAINPKYQAKINRVIAWNKKYDDEVNAMDHCDTDKAIAKSERLQEKYWNKACEAMEYLPKRECANIAKQLTVYL